MQLNSSDGASGELRIAGYQYPDYYKAPSPEALQRLMGGANIPVVFGKSDLNWLQVSGNIIPADGTAWAFSDPCLTTSEARELGDWLRQVAAGIGPPRGCCDSQGWLTFIEPNVGFTLEDRTAGRVRITVEFTGEVKPPLVPGRSGVCTQQLLRALGCVR
jgi:hypothetical protein